MKTSSVILFLCLIICSCGSSGNEDEHTLDEAQRVHNEAMAVFSETYTLLDELTEVKAELAQNMGLATEAGTTGQSDSLTQGDNLVPDSMDNEHVTTGDQSGQSDQSGQEGDQQINQQSESDTTGQGSSNQILEELNQVHASLMNWMRNIYKVPDKAGVYTEHKSGDKPAIGLDINSEMMFNNIEIKEYPEDTSPEEILESQKEIKEEIVQIQKDIRKAVSKARKETLN